MSVLGPSPEIHACPLPEFLPFYHIYFGAVAPCQLAWHKPEFCQLEKDVQPSPSRSPSMAASGWGWGIWQQSS